MKENDAPVLMLNGEFVRVWVFERINCDDVRYGREASKASYDEPIRRHVLRQRGFTDKPISREVIWTGECRYKQAVN